jgi:predicted nucleotidyltransferase
MKPTDPLSTALASGAMARLLRFFAVNPDARPHLRALERLTALWPRSLQRELERLTALGLLLREEEAANVYYRLHEAHPAWPHFRQLVRHLSDPVDILPFALADVPRIDAAFIFGSHAKGWPRADSDIDLFVLGDQIDEAKLARGGLEASVLLDREIDVLHLTRAEFAERLAAGRRFFHDLLADEKLWIAGSPEVLDDIAAEAADTVASARG